MILTVKMLEVMMGSLSIALCEPYPPGYDETKDEDLIMEWQETAVKAQDWIVQELDKREEKAKGEFNRYPLSSQQTPYRIT